jgi:hypothetical protein
MAQSQPVKIPAPPPQHSHPAQKYPINAERLPDRRGFKFTAENVAMCLKAAGEQK